MSVTTCRHCGTPTPGPLLCRRHTQTLLVALRHVAEYHPELDVLATRQARMSDPAGPGSIGKTQPLPVDARFVDTGKAGGSARHAPGSVLRTKVHTSLDRWCRTLTREHPDTPDPRPRVDRGGPRHDVCAHPSCLALGARPVDRPARDTVPAMCAYLARQARIVLTSPWVGELLVELLDAEHQLRRTIDRPPERWYAGVCSARRLHVNDHGAIVDDGECPVDLYAEQDARTVTCPGCGTEHQVDARRAYLLDQVDDQLVTATEASAALVAFSQTDADRAHISQRVRDWARRGRLERRGTIEVAGQERPTYRLGDVRTLLLDTTRHAETRS